MIRSSVGAAWLVALALLSGDVRSPHAATIPDGFSDYEAPSAADWEQSEAELASGAHALVLYDGTIIDDTNIAIWATRVHHYRRTRILDEAGARACRIATLEYPGTARLQRCTARVVSRDGIVREIRPDAMRKLEWVGVGRLRSRQRSIDFGAITPGSLVEYIYSYEYQDGPPHSALLQGAAPARDVELWWRYRVISRDTAHIISEHVANPDEYFFTPRWVVMNGIGFSPQVELLPNIRHADTVHLRAHDVPAVPDEPYAPPLETLAGRFVGHYVYPERNEKTPYWERWASAEGERLEGKVLVAGTGVRDWVADLRPMPRDLDADLSRLLARIRRDLAPNDSASMGSDEDRSVEAVLLSRRAEPRELDLLLLTGLRLLGYDARLFLARDRERGVFVEDWENPWQFTASGVAVLPIGAVDSTSIRFCSASLGGETGASLPWQLLGCRALLLGPSGAARAGTNQAGSTSPNFPRFATIGLGAAADNSSELRASVRLSAEGAARGTARCQWRAKNDPDWTAWLRTAPREDAAVALREAVLGQGEGVEVSDEEFVVDGDLVAWSCSLSVSRSLDPMESSWAMRPGRMLAEPVTLSTTPRRLDLHFRHPWQARWRVQVELPAGWTCVTPPEFRLDEPFGSAEVVWESSSGSVELAAGAAFYHPLLLSSAAVPVQGFFDALRAAMTAPITLHAP